MNIVGSFPELLRGRAENYPTECNVKNSLSTDTITSAGRKNAQKALQKVSSISLNVKIGVEAADKRVLTEWIRAR
jgi:hypothetical protein